jgi:hypothetical protein
VNISINIRRKGTHRQSKECVQKWSPVSKIDSAIWWRGFNRHWWNITFCINSIMFWEMNVYWLRPRSVFKRLITTFKRAQYINKCAKWRGNSSLAPTRRFNTASAKAQSHRPILTTTYYYLSSSFMVYQVAVFQEDFLQKFLLVT